jgi:hypothetical protein
MHYYYTCIIIMLLLKTEMLVAQGAQYESRYEWVWCVCKYVWKMQKLNII